MTSVLRQSFFSVVIPTYNRAESIGKAVQSVVEQTFKDWELIVVDDASTDDTQDMLSGFADSRIRVFCNEQNRERSFSRNRGISEAQGRYICFLDSDDYYLPDHLATLRRRVAETGEGRAVALSCRRDFGEDSIDVLTASRRDSSLSEAEQIIRHHIPVNTLAIPRTALPDPAFDVRFRINEDVHLFALLAASGVPFRYFDDVTSVWVCQGQNTASQEMDYMTPQIECMRDLFALPEIRAQTRASFRRRYLGNLYAGLSHVACERNQSPQALAAALRAAVMLRGTGPSRSALGHVIYSLPGGQVLGRLKRRLAGRTRSDL
jgi:hypothetical protein